MKKKLVLFLLLLNTVRQVYGALTTEQALGPTIYTQNYFQLRAQAVTIFDQPNTTTQSVSPEVSLGATLSKLANISQCYVPWSRRNPKEDQPKEDQSTIDQILQQCTNDNEKIQYLLGKLYLDDQTFLDLFTLKDYVNSLKNDRQTRLKTFFKPLISNSLISSKFSTDMALVDMLVNPQYYLQENHPTETPIDKDVLNILRYSIVRVNFDGNLDTGYKNKNNTLSNHNLIHRLTLICLKTKIKSTGFFRRHYDIKENELDQFIRDLCSYSTFEVAPILQPVKQNLEILGVKIQDDSWWQRAFNVLYCTIIGDSARSIDTKSEKSHLSKEPPKQPSSSWSSAALSPLNLLTTMYFAIQRALSLSL